MEALASSTAQFLATLGIQGDYTLFNNSLSAYALALVIFVISYAILKLFQYLVLVKLRGIAKRTPITVDDTVVKIAESVRPSFYAIVSIWLALHTLNLHPWIDTALTVITIGWAVYQAVIAFSILLDDVLLTYVAADSTPNTRSALKLIGRIAKGVLWGLGVILLLSNIGVDVTSLVAGLGIGGIAVAFALQGILSDLFSSFSIYFDKPFEIGDFIIIDELMGTVEHIGVKSTRLRSLSGEELVLSNHYLTSAKIHNYKKMAERRVVFTLGVVYDTTSEKLQEGIEILKEAITSRSDSRLDRVHFSAFGEYALQYECVHYILVPDYNAYMDAQQEINFFIKNRFDEAGIVMAFPTQVVHLASSSAAVRV